MKKLIDLIQEELVKAFTAAEMDPSYARVSVSNRPDLWQLQKHTTKHRSSWLKQL